MQFAHLLERRRASGDHGAVEPPVPIPNTEVKRRSADGSIAIGYARVGRCQYLPHPVLRDGVFLWPEDGAWGEIAALVGMRRPVPADI